MSTRIIRMPEVLHWTGLSASAVERLERDGKFPRRRRISSQAVGWLATEVEDWIDNRPPVELSQKKNSA